MGGVGALAGGGVEEHGQNHRRRLTFLPPVAAHETVRHVPVGDVLAVLDGHVDMEAEARGTHAALLAEIGDCRERFPTPEALACLAGAAPSTRQSGKHRAVTFRYACDKKLRDAVIDFAAGSRFANASGPCCRASLAKMIL